MPAKSKTGDILMRVLVLVAGGAAGAVVQKQLNKPENNMPDWLKEYGVLGASLVTAIFTGGSGIVGSLAVGSTVGSGLALATQKLPFLQGGFDYSNAIAGQMYSKAIEGADYDVDAVLDEFEESSMSGEMEYDDDDDDGFL